MKERVTLSQCMIVKNEEGNIQRALSWGKGIMHEQIVVDTGSTDRTVEIAEQMGASVYHFQWDEDFAAAKNYAIEQATGDWIAFLDADEYCTPEQAPKILPLLQRIENEFSPRQKPHIVNCAMLQMDERGNVFSVTAQSRFFRNMKGLRYKGRIHEQIFLESGQKPLGLNAFKDLEIVHTGYSASAFKEKSKIERNLVLLQKELAERPDDAQMLAYLGETLLSSGDLDAAESTFRKLVHRKDDLLPVRYAKMCVCLMKLLVEKKEVTEEDRVLIERLYTNSVAADSSYPDPDYFMGFWRLRDHMLEESCRYFENALKKLDKMVNTVDLFLVGELKNTYLYLALSYAELNDPAASVKYCILGLRLDRYMDLLTAQLLTLLKKDKVQSQDIAGIIDLFSKIYDFHNLKDKLYLYKHAKAVEFDTLGQELYGLFTETEQAWLNGEG